MSRILISGMSGVGKSTLLAVLAARGHRTVDTDYEEWTSPDGLWDESRMTELLDQHRDIVISGTVSNQGTFYDRFDYVLLLSAPIDTLLERVLNRTTNPYGRTAEQRAEIQRNHAQVEPLLRRGANVELDGRRSPSDLADEVEGLR